jgi:diadenosine tetraphosphate (Ap4A) HIT family hydrolase
MAGTLMQQAPFTSLQTFRQAFEQGLVDMLELGGLGPFILVCANANFDPIVDAATRTRLEASFTALAEEYRIALAAGRPVQAVDEDLLVFLKIHTIGLAQLKATEMRTEGPWTLQFNHLRSFRPKRITTTVPADLHMAFDANAFHFNKPFMQKEAFWSGELGGRQATLYYNKYPFANLHALLVPERELELPQFLSEPLHSYVFELATMLADALPGIGFGYNSLGAFASVNHLHFQMFVDPQVLPVASPHWQHNGGSSDYPATVRAFSSTAEAWAFLQTLHEEGTPYNALYLPGVVYVFPRKKQGTYPQPSWTSGFTWHEMAGGMITFNRDDFVMIDETIIMDELSRIRID